MLNLIVLQLRVARDLSDVIKRGSLTACFAKTPEIEEYIAATLPV